MPKRARELSAVEVRRLSRPGLHAVGGVPGLLLRISDTGAKYWLMRVTIAGQRHDMGLGAFPELSLAKARESGAEIRERVRNGHNPLAERRERRHALISATAKTLTFDEAARRYIGTKATEFDNPKHAKQWRSTLATYASPVIGSLPVAEIDVPHILQVLEPIWRTKTETASRVRGRIEKVLAWASVSGFRSGENPAQWRGKLDALLPSPSKLAKVKHHRALDWRQAPEFFAELKQREGMGALALQFLILTAARSGEVRGATWDEIDMKARTWTIPAERMKARTEHVVPLSDAALALLESAPRFEGSPYVFPSVRGGQQSDMALTALMRRMEADATPHGFRSTFRTWAAEATDYPREIAEKSLAHTIPSAVERAYLRGLRLEKRAALMTDWARYLTRG